MSSNSGKGDGAREDCYVREGAVGGELILAGSDALLPKTVEGMSFLEIEKASFGVYNPFTGCFTRFSPVVHCELANPSLASPESEGEDK